MYDNSEVEEQLDLITKESKKFNVFFINDFLFFYI